MRQISDPGCGKQNGPETLGSKILLKPKEVANILKITPRQVYYLCDIGILDTMKIKSSLRIKVRSVKELIGKCL